MIQCYAFCHENLLSFARLIIGFRQSIPITEVLMIFTHDIVYRSCC